VIDEYRIMVFPVLLGSGKRLFKEAIDTTHLELFERGRSSRGSAC
jgi:dihydrofolate reductase